MSSHSGTSAMAQVCGGSTHDFDWDRTIETALSAIRAAADGWAIWGIDAYSVETVAAYLVRTFVSYWKGYPVIGGTFDQAIKRVEALDQECQRFPRKLRLDDLAELCDEIRLTLGYAANEWAEGDSENPETEHVLNWIVEVLFEFRLVRRPAKPSWPMRPIFRQ